MPARRFAVLVFLALFAAFPAGWGQRASRDDLIKAAVLRNDEARAYATVAANTLALEDQLHDNCLYAHSNGRVQTKKEFIAALARGDLHYDVMRYLAVPTVRLFGNETAIVNGRAHLEATAKGGVTLNQDIIYTAVYVIVDEQWKLASYHSAAAPK